MKTPLAIIEDQPSIRQAFVTYLSAQPEFDVVLVADSVEDFIARLGEARHLPRLILSDIGLPGMSGIDGIGLIRQHLPLADVVLITVYQDADRVFKALCAGAVGYLIKATPLTEIKDGLLDVLNGGSPMSPAIARHIVRYFRPEQQPTEELTVREQQLVRAIGDGLSYKLIADRMGISLNTVRTYIRIVYRKLEINSKAELTAQAVKRGWANPMSAA
jgi:DNA-binding NarL/FixJ family response regulator